MAYTFQSWAVAQVLTAAAISQTEINIRDHVHGVSGVASIPFDMIQNRALVPAANTFIRDEFIGGVNGRPAGGLAGELGWYVLETSGNLAATSLQVAGHPGVATLYTGTVVNDKAYISLCRYYLEPSDYLDAIFVLKVPSVTAVALRLGFTASDPSDSATQGFYLEKQTGDTNWFAITRGASAETRVDTNIAVAIETWYKLRIRRINATTIGFTVNAGTEITSTTNIPTVGLCVGISVKTTATVSKELHIDYFDMLVTGLTR